METQHDRNNDENSRKVTRIRASFWIEPDRDDFIKPFNDSELVNYFKEINLWHGYIKFLGMPSLRDNNDVRLNQLFVEPKTCSEYLSPDAELIEHPDCWSILYTLKKHPYLWLLGDPGSGKSTLISWLSWIFTRPEGSIYVSELGALIPFPFVLRELSITPAVTWDQLLDLYLQKPMAKALKDRSKVDEILNRGQALLMFDGLDEIGSKEIRIAVKIAIIDLMCRYPNCRILVTSRIIGYDEVSIDNIPTDKTLIVDEPQNWQNGYLEWLDNQVIDGSDTTNLADINHRWLSKERYSDGGSLMHRCYIMPFDDKQIMEFSQKWYAIREPVEHEAKSKTVEFIEALYQNASILRLARIPNILSFMAIIHRVKAQLPHGRARLYSQIAEAYLQSIDEFRGLRNTEYTLSQKMRWLGFIGYQMQLRRFDDLNNAESLLVDENDLIQWILDEMERTTRTACSLEEVENFIDFIGRRSGLLIPRGEGKFAFVHLSFQEYFSAFYISALFLSPSAKNSDIYTQLKEYKNNRIWHETFVLLFEIMADINPEWVDRLLSNVFSPYSKNSDDGRSLLAVLSIDPHTSIKLQDRQKIWRSLLKYIKSNNEQSDRNEVMQTLLLPGEYQSNVWESIQSIWRNSTRLDIMACTGVTDITPLAQMTSLKELSLFLLPYVTNVEPLGQLANLKVLSLVACDGITDITPLEKLTGLRELFLMKCNNIIDIEPIAQLEILMLISCRGITDMTPLVKFSKLKMLSYEGQMSTTILSQITRLSSLEALVLSKCPDLSNITPLAELRTLISLTIRSCTNMIDISSLAQLVRLGDLSLDECTNIIDITPLTQLRNLFFLSLEGCMGITDVTPLAQLETLEELDLKDCVNITDISPIAQLVNLRELNLTGCTGITDISSLAHLSELKIIH